jgi:hypothetical protein
VRPIQQNTLLHWRAKAWWLRQYATNRQVAGSVHDGVTGFFSSDIILPVALWPGVDSASNRNKYQVYPGGKGGRCVRLTTYHHTVPLSRNLGALTSLDPSGPAWPAWPVTEVLYLYLLRYSIL